jgi:hypothetical protein
MDGWRELGIGQPYKVADVIRLSQDSATYPTLHAALTELSGKDTKAALVQALTKYKNRVLGGMMFDGQQDRKRTMMWQLRKVA